MATARSLHFDSCSLILAPPAGESREDNEIIRLQQEIQQAADPSQSIERLGWAFVAKARASFDDFYFKLAEHCALCMESRRPGSFEAILLRGHVLHNQHRFKEAEPLARSLVAKRGLPFDYGLLGDVLMEQGRLVEATEAYQTMIDLRPDLQSYARGAHIRWLKGDLAGAVELMRLAASAASPVDPESAAWANTRFAFYHLQAEDFEAAHRVCDMALNFQKDYAPALLLRGQVFLAEGEAAAAIEPLRRASELIPLPEYQWTLAEALRAQGRTNEAFAIEKKLRQTGAAADPRTFSLFLATRSNQGQTALRLARRELNERGDVFTHDALAWSLQAAGQIEEALSHMEKALAEGTQDARLSFHAAVIAAKAGRQEEARQWFEKTFEKIHLLLPSEQEQLQAAALSLNADNLDDPVPAADAVSGSFSAPGPQLVRRAEH
jgi:tetratricopeptide (TPR) repeat protein